MLGVAAADADRNSQTPPPPASAQQVEQDPIDQHDFKMWEFDSLGKIAWDALEYFVSNLKEHRS